MPNEKEKKGIYVVEIATASEPRLKNPETDEIIDLYQALATIMNDIEEIKKRIA